MTKTSTLPLRLLWNVILPPAPLAAVWLNCGPLLFGERGRLGSLQPARRAARATVGLRYEVNRNRMFPPGTPEKKNRPSELLAQPVSRFAPLEAWATQTGTPRGSTHLRGCNMHQVQP